MKPTQNLAALQSAEAYLVAELSKIAGSAEAAMALAGDTNSIAILKEAARIRLEGILGRSLTTDQAMSWLENFGKGGIKSMKMDLPKILATGKGAGNVEGRVFATILGAKTEFGVNVTPDDFTAAFSKLERNFTGGNPATQAQQVLANEYLFLKSEAASLNLSGADETNFIRDGLEDSDSPFKTKQDIDAHYGSGKTTIDPKTGESVAKKVTRGGAYRQALAKPLKGAISRSTATEARSIFTELRRVGGRDLEEFVAKFKAGEPAMSQYKPLQDLIKKVKAIEGGAASAVTGGQQGIRLMLEQLSRGEPVPGLTSDDAQRFLTPVTEQLETTARRPQAPQAPQVPEGVIADPGRPVPRGQSIVPYNPSGRPEIANFRSQQRDAAFMGSKGPRSPVSMLQQTAGKAKGLAKVGRFAKHAATGVGGVLVIEELLNMNARRELKRDLAREEELYQIRKTKGVQPSERLENVLLHQQLRQQQSRGGGGYTRIDPAGVPGQIML